MMFQFRHHNRKTYPTKHILVCEDILDVQARLARHFCDLFEHEGPVQVSFVPGALFGACVLNSGLVVDLVLLDRDMPNGNGDDLLGWMQKAGLKIPVITLSGIPANNDALMALGATHRFDKQAVIDGAADALIKQILEVP